MDFWSPGIVKQEMQVIFWFSVRKHITYPAVFTAADKREIICKHIKGITVRHES